MTKQRLPRAKEDDLALWRRVAAEVTPLPGRERLPAPLPPPLPPPLPSIEPAETRLPHPARRQPKAARPGPAAPASHAAPVAGLDRRSALRLRRGQLPIEARIDLHGMTQTAAHAALAGFVRREQAAGRRVVLVVTGKGAYAASRDPEAGPGVLKRAVPRWLETPPLRDLVLAAAPARPKDGGAGALYVLLRRTRGERPL